MKIKVKITEPCSLFEAISRAAPISASCAKRLIKNREAKVNGERVGNNFDLCVGDEMECFVPEAFLGEPPEVVYEDENVLIADKPALVEVVPMLRDMLKGENDFLEPVHRIDRNTVGLVAFAKNEQAYNELTLAIKERRVTKRYLALTIGTPKVGEYIAYLHKNSADYVCHISATPRKDYKKIVTVIEKVERRGELSLVTIRLVTGRTHQIRAHLAFLGFPIAGDGKYGEGNRKYGSRQKLCAYELSFSGLSGKMNYLNEKVFTSSKKLLTDKNI